MTDVRAALECANAASVVLTGLAMLVGPPMLLVLVFEAKLWFADRRERKTPMVIFRCHGSLLKAGDVIEDHFGQQREVLEVGSRRLLLLNLPETDYSRARAWTAEEYAGRGWRRVWPGHVKKASGD